MFKIVFGLVREIIWTGGLPHLSGLPHLTGVSHLHVNRPFGWYSNKVGTSNNYNLGECDGERGAGSEWQCEGGAKPDGLVILRNQNQTLLSIRTSAAVFISVIDYPPTLQSLPFHFSSKMQERTGTFYIYLAKPLSKVHVSKNRSNTD